MKLRHPRTTAELRAISALEDDGHRVKGRKRTRIPTYLEDIQPRNVRSWKTYRLCRYK